MDDWLHLQFGKTTSFGRSSAFGQGRSSDDALLVRAAACFIACYCNCALAQTAEEHVHSMSHTVMPFT